MYAPTATHLDDDTIPDLTHTLTPWLVCLTAGLFFFYEFIQLHMFNAINGALMNEFNISAVQISKLSASYLCANTLFLFPAGLLLDRYSTRKIIIAAMTLCVVSTLLFAFASTWKVAAFYHFLTGLGSSFCFLSCLKLASRWFPPKRLALITGLIVTMAMLGGAMAQSPMVILTEHFGWRNTIMANVCLGMIIWFLIVFIIRDYPPHSERIREKEHKSLNQIGFWSSIILAGKNVQNWIGGLYTSLLNIPLMVLGGLWGIPYLMHVHHLDHTNASLVTTMIFAGTIIGSPVLGWASDKIGLRKMPMVVGALLSLFSALLLIYLPTPGFFTLLALFFWLGFITSTQVIIYPLITESNITKITGTALGIAATIIMALPGIIELLFGWLMELHWNGTMHNGAPVYSSTDYQLGMWVFPVCCLGALLVALLLKETHCKHKDTH